MASVRWGRRLEIAVELISITGMTNSLIILARSNYPVGQLASAAEVSGEDYEFGLGWRMFVTQSDIPGSLPEIAKAVFKETGYPAVVGFANDDPGYLGIVFCEKGRTDLTYVTGVAEAKADGFVGPKFKHHPMSAIGAAVGWSKKAGLNSSYDALKAAANRAAAPAHRVWTCCSPGWWVWAYRSATTSTRTGTRSAKRRSRSARRSGGRTWRSGSISDPESESESGARGPGRARRCCQPAGRGPTPWSTVSTIRAARASGSRAAAVPAVGVSAVAVPAAVVPAAAGLQARAGSPCRTSPMSA